MSEARETGAIHDIGFRRYTGPRLGSAYITRSLLVHSLRGAFGLGRSARSKVMPFLLLAVMVVPALIMVAVVVLTDGDELPVEYSSYAMNLLVVVAVFVGATAPQSVSRDLRFRVVSLYFSRPIDRRGYVLAKLVATSAAVFILLAAPLVVLYGGALLGQLDFWSNTREFLSGVAGAAIFAIVLASIGLLVAAWTPRRGLGIAAVVAVLLLSSAVSAIVQQVGDDEGNEALAGWAGALSPFALVDGVQVWALGAESSTVTGPPDGIGGPAFVLLTLALVGVCYLLLVRRYRSESAA